MNVEAFIERWTDQDGGAERANYATFLIELCDVIGVSRPDPASAVTEKNDYVFERFVRRSDGSNGRIDLYKRDCFVLEAKQSRQNVRTLTGETNDKFLPEQPRQLSLDLPQDSPTRGKRGAKRGWDVLMVNARQQAEDYARHLPQDHGWPPFVIVCDVGHSLEIFADFRRMGKYEQFPDRQSYRIYLSDLRDEKMRERLRCIWTDPYALDPSKRAAKTTREIAKRLAEVTKALEAKKADPEHVAHFLMRCIFTMFAEDWKLLPQDSFTKLLERSVDDPVHFARRLKSLWTTMDKGGWSDTIDADVRRFNGGLFAETTVFELGKEEIGELLAAAKADWREVEPAIFGTLLEQALDPKERKKLGAHYTPRAYVERLVTATIIDPLRADWSVVLTTAEERRAAGDEAGAIAAVQAFHDTLCETRVLDPACGTGNFLYVALELMKRLEGEVLEALADLGGQEALTGLEGHTVDPHQFLGLELNTRAAAIAELVLWIGYLQQHFRTNGAAPSDPILKAFKNINFGKPGGYDAVLTWDDWPVPKVVDGKESYPNARRPAWPEAEFIVGNPPFMGGSIIRSRLDDGYAETLWKVHKQMNASADFVMYWWDRAAEQLTRKGSQLRRFGFVTTNSITQEFSRRVIRKRMDSRPPIGLLMAIPDHPWTKADKDAAAVRIAMTVTAKGEQEGVLREVIRESDLNTDEPKVEFRDRVGRINADLTIGDRIANRQALTSNIYLAHKGMQLNGQGFVLSAQERKQLERLDGSNAEGLIRPYVNGRDLTQEFTDRYVIDPYGLSEADFRRRAPHVYERILRLVKPERDAGRREGRRERWWLHGEPHTSQRGALQSLGRFIATTRTSKHRIFSFLSGNVVAESKVVVIALDDGFFLSALSSRIHLVWALKTGGFLEDRPTYQHLETFDPFPFPDPSEALKADVRAAGEELDAFRKARQAEHRRLTLTQMYNVREAIRAGRPLTPDELRIKEEGLILILNELHDRIDALTLAAYGWPEGLSDEEVLERLVALNKARAAEERRGHVRWLRPDYQKPRAGVVEVKAETAQMDLGPAAVKTVKPLFPAGAIDQGAAVAAALFASSTPIDATAIALTFRQGRKLDPKIAAILHAMVRTAAASTRDGGKTFQGRRAA